MLEAIGGNAVTITVALLTGGGIVKALDLWATRRARDVSNDILLSAEARAIAAEVRAERAAERVEAKADRLRMEEELETERREHATTRERLSDAEHEIAMLKRDVADLKKLLHAHGINAPGETPPRGTLAVSAPVAVPEQGTGE